MPLVRHLSRVPANRRDYKLRSEMTASEVKAERAYDRQYYAENRNEILARRKEIARHGAGLRRKHSSMEGVKVKSPHEAAKHYFEKHHGGAKSEHEKGASLKKTVHHTHKPKAPGLSKKTLHKVQKHDALRVHQAQQYGGTSTRPHIPKM